jgi:hypothetical protein
MTTPDKRIDNMENDLKLLKSEIKQGLTDVQEFLLSLKTPPLQVEVDPPYGEIDARGNGGGMPGALTLKDGGESGFSESANQPETEADTEEVEHMPTRESVIEPAQQQQQQPQQMEKEVIPIFEKPRRGLKTEKPEDKKAEPVADKSAPLPEISEQKPGKPDSSIEAAKPASASAAPQVNLLANLIRWVSVAKKEIGEEQLPVILDVYGSSGNLAPEMREVILQLAEVAVTPSEDGSPKHSGRFITGQLSAFLEIHRVSGHISAELKQDILHFVGLIDDQAVSNSTADIWSRLVLELHGILSDSSAPLRPFKKTSKSDKNIEKNNGHNTDGEIHEGKLRLKLVMPVADGIEREFDVL